MKKIILSFVLVIISLASIHAEKAIVVKQKWTGSEFKNADVTVTWYVTATNCKMKMDFVDGKINTTTWFIPDLANGVMLTYVDGPAAPGTAKTYFSTPIGNVQSFLPEVSRINVKKTGEVQTVSGIASQKMIVKTNRFTTEMWVSSAFTPDFYKFSPFFQMSYPLLGLSNDDIQGVPLSSVTKDLGGKVISSEELISVTETELNPSDFTVPSDYQLFSAAK